jgi:hypothetical protein
MRRGAGYSILFVAGHDPKDCSSGIPCHSKAGPIENHREGKLFHTVVFLSPELDSSIRFGKIV